jgi:hypothetical protein
VLCDVTRSAGAETQQLQEACDNGASAVVVVVVVVGGCWSAQQRCVQVRCSSSLLSSVRFWDGRPQQLQSSAEIAQFEAAFDQVATTKVVEEANGFALWLPGAAVRAEGSG